MFLVGIQEEEERGLWGAVLEMDRKQVIKKYRWERAFFHPFTEMTALGDLFAEMHRDASLRTRKKQFSQLGRPPKYTQVPPRILFRPHAGRLREEHRAFFSAFRICSPLILLDEKETGLSQTCEQADARTLLALLAERVEEKRLDGENFMIPEGEGPEILALAVALWGGEKVWRPVRYGG